MNDIRPPDPSVRPPAPAPPASTRTRGQWLVLLAAFLGWMFDGLQQGVMPLVGRPALQDLLRVEDDRQIALWMGGITALFLLGAAGGGVVFGWLGDRFGRAGAATRPADPAAGAGRIRSLG